MFPTIKTLDDVLPYIQGSDTFLHIVKEGYSVIDYVGVNGNKTFPKKGEDNWQIYRECRGLIFNEAGNIISRPLTKAFNYGERPDEDVDHDWSNILITDKRDGSLIRPLWLNGGWRLATRKGVTDVAIQAETFLTRSGNWEKYKAFFNACWEGVDGESHTPIFEFTSRENRIVLDYPEDSLTLLAIRNLYTGEYVDYKSMYHNAVYRYGIPVVDIFSFPNQEASLEEKIQYIRELKNLEGIVVQFLDSQEMVKIKAEDYCNLHRTKAYLDNERSVVACLVNDQADDLRPLLSPNQLIRFDEFEDKFWKGFHANKSILWELILEGRKYTSDKKTFAVEYVNKQLPQWRPILFWLNNNNDMLNRIDIHEVNDCLKSFIKYTNQEAVNSCRWIFNSKW